MNNNKLKLLKIHIDKIRLQNFHKLTSIHSRPEEFQSFIFFFNKNPRY